MKNWSIPEFVPKVTFSLCYFQRLLCDKIVFLNNVNKSTQLNSVIYLEQIMRGLGNAVPNGVNGGTRVQRFNPATQVCFTATELLYDLLIQSYCMCFRY